MIAALGTPGRHPAYDWLSPAAAALRLGVAVRDVYRLIDTGNLPGYRIAHEVRLLAHEVETLRTVGGRDDLEAVLFERGLQNVHLGRRIVDDHDQCHVSSS